MVYGIQFLNVWQTLHMFMGCLFLFVFGVFWAWYQKKCKIPRIYWAEDGTFLLLTDVTASKECLELQGQDCSR